MNFSRTLRLALVFVLLVVAHYTLRPLLGWRAPIDFLVIALLLVAVRTRPGVAALAGLALGLLSDSLTPESFGAGALAMSAVGFAASRLKAAFFADNIALNAAFIFIGKWACDTIFLLAERRLRGSDLLAQFALWSPLSAAATAVAGAFVLLLVRPLFREQRA